MESDDQNSEERIEDPTEEDCAGHSSSRYATSLPDEMSVLTVKDEKTYSDTKEDMESLAVAANLPSHGYDSPVYPVAKGEQEKENYNRHHTHPRNSQMSQIANNNTNVSVGQKKVSKVFPPVRAFNEDAAKTVQPVGDDGDDSRLPLTTREWMDEEDLPMGASEITVTDLGPLQEIENLRNPSASEPFPFTITRRGCNVSSPYCNLHCPPGAVLHAVDVIMSPEYYPQDVLDNDKIFITPYVKFDSESSDGIVFDKDVELMIRTSYSAIDSEKPVPVKMVRRSGEEICLTDSGQPLIKNFVTLKCRRFSGVAGALSREDLKKTKRGYYSAAYFRGDQGDQAATIHWLIYDDIQVQREEKMSYLGSRRIAFDPESFSIRYSDELQLKIMGGSSASNVKPENLTVSLQEFYGDKIDESYQFGVVWVDDRDARPMQTLSYQISRKSEQSITPIKTKNFFPNRGS